MGKIAKIEDYEDIEYGRLFIKELYAIEPGKKVRKCRCECRVCGRTDYITYLNHVTSGNTSSCGCSINKSELVKGEKFDKLTVINFHKRNERKVLIYKCKCECGKITLVSKGNLRSKHTISCGCMLGVGLKTHGKSKSLSYKVEIYESKML